MAQLFQCPMCIFICSTPNEWLAHLRTTNHEENFNVSCCFEDCSHSPFSTFAGLKSHVYRTHLNSEEIPSAEENDQHIHTEDTHIEGEDTQDEAILDQSMIEADLSRLLQVDSQQTSGVARRMIEMWHSGCAREKIVRGFRGVRSEMIQRTERSRN